MVEGKPWVENGPEDRLSIATFRFLNDALAPNFYVTMIHDRDEGKRSMQQRIRSANRGIRKGQLDCIVDQGPPHLNRRVELKRGDNKPTASQLLTIRDLTACGGRPIVAWELVEVYLGLLDAGFRFQPNVGTKLAYYERLLEAWDREASLVLSGAVVKKPAKPRAAKPRPAALKAVARARAAGIRT
jgi:hypothetical protein